ncbi:hypothetical protein [Micromonospora sp. WMMD737]|uniref:hypothetical protein n=1 Tax=Micromonospora sp. WMMD737 TaxID=3404113 RepID=UPI003B943F2B
MSTTPPGVTVAITERRAPASPQVQQDRTEAVERLGALGMIDPATGTQPADVLVGFDVTIAGVTLPVPAVAYEVVPGEMGPQVTLTLQADTVTLGAAQPSPVAAARAARSRTWEPTPVDPRRDIPGWAPEGLEVTDRG